MPLLTKFQLLSFYLLYYFRKAVFLRHRMFGAFSTVPGSIKWFSPTQFCPGGVENCQNTENTLGLVSPEEFRGETCASGRFFDTQKKVDSIIGQKLGRSILQEAYENNINCAFTKPTSISLFL